MTAMRLLYVVLAVTTVVSAVLWTERERFGAWAGAWLPEIGSSALGILVTIAVVNRIIENRAREQASDRVHQALARIRGGFHVLADFALWDYADLHPYRYERPPKQLPQLLDHFRSGLDTRDAPWPENPRVLAATDALAGYVEQQIQRHESVLDHAFIAAGYRYIRMARMSRNMYADDEQHHDIDAWKKDALDGAIGSAKTLYEAYEPYAAGHIEKASVELREDEIASIERIRDIDGGDD
jgi:hypothetical protein